MASILVSILVEVLKEVIRVVFSKRDVDEVGVMDEVLTTPVDHVLSRGRGLLEF